MASMIGCCARTVPVNFRRNITYVEKRAAIIYETGLRRTCSTTKVYGEKINPIEAIKKESEFIARYRFPKATVRMLAKGFGESPFWEKETPWDAPCCRRFVNGEWIACMGLRYLATGAQLQLLCDVQGTCCKSMISTSVQRFISYLAAMSATNVKFPDTPEGLFELEQKVAQRFALHGCVAFKDGTYVPVNTPIVNEKAFFCRKYYHAINVMIICDADMRILAIDASKGGAHADATVFDQSVIGQRILHENLLGDYYIVGDCGYSLREQVMTPFTSKELSELKTPAREAYQARITGARSVVENCNAQLKGRWRVLSKYGSGVIMRDIHTCGLIIRACAYVHNLALDVGLAKVTRENVQDPDFERLLRQNALIFLMNAVKRNQYRRFHAQRRPQLKDDYIAGCRKRDQLLREQFGERSICLGRVAKRTRGRPLGGGVPRPLAVRQAAAAGRGRGRGRPRAVRPAE